MDMTMTSVAPENVRFAIPKLALPQLRGLTMAEIDSVLGPWGTVGGAAVLGLAAWAACEFG